MAENKDNGALGLPGRGETQIVKNLSDFRAEKVAKV